MGQFIYLLIGLGVTIPILYIVVKTKDDKAKLLLPSMVLIFLGGYVALFGDFTEFLMKATGELKIVRKTREKAEQEYDKIVEMSKIMGKRLQISELADDAILNSSRKSFDELKKIANSEKDDNDLQAAAEAEESRVITFWYSLLRKRTENLPIKNQDGTIVKFNEITTERLKKYLLESEMWDVRQLAAKSLMNRKEKGVAEALITSMKTEQNLGVLKEVLWAFDKLTDGDYGTLNYEEKIAKWPKIQQEYNNKNFN